MHKVFASETVYLRSRGAHGSTGEQKQSAREQWGDARYIKREDVVNPERYALKMTMGQSPDTRGGGG